MTAKEPTVERGHRTVIAEIIRQRHGHAGSATWVETGVWQGSSEFDGLYDVFAQAIANAEAEGLANRDERCLQSDMQRIRERLASEKAWDEGYGAGRRDEYWHLVNLTHGVTYQPASNPYRLPPKGDDK